MVVKLSQENENFGFYRKFKIKNVINSYAFYTKRCVFTPPKLFSQLCLIGVLRNTGSDLIFDGILIIE